MSCALVAGCHHVGPPGDHQSPDGGDAGDSDNDSEWEFPTDTDQGFCQAEPVICVDVGPTPAEQYAGCCFEGALYWCWETDQIWVDSIDCELNGGYCGYDPLDQWMDCIYD